jgi:RNA polymerase sigma-70 factor (ECF subfamily)
MTDRQEIAIINDVREGNTDQYRFFVERYHRGLVQHLYNIVRDGHMAEDIAQDAFIQAYEKLSQYNENYAFSTWLYKIADHLAYRQLKRLRPMSDIDELQELLPDDKTPVYEEVDKELDRGAVRQALDNLPHDYRQVVTLYYWDDRSYEEIAEIIERPIGTVRTWLFRAKDQLRKELYEQI